MIEVFFILFMFYNSRTKISYFIKIHVFILKLWLCIIFILSIISKIKKKLLKKLKYFLNYCKYLKQNLIHIFKIEKIKISIEIFPYFLNHYKDRDQCFEIYINIQELIRGF